VYAKQLVKMMLDMKKCLDEHIDEVREWLQSIDDGCPHLHHVKYRHDDSDDVDDIESSA